MRDIAALENVEGDDYAIAVFRLNRIQSILNISPELHPRLVEMAENNPYVKKAMAIVNYLAGYDFLGGYPTGVVELPDVDVRALNEDEFNERVRTDLRQAPDLNELLNRLAKHYEERYGTPIELTLRGLSNSGYGFYYLHYDLVNNFTELAPPENEWLIFRFVERQPKISLGNILGKVVGKRNRPRPKDLGELLKALDSGFEITQISYGSGYTEYNVRLHLNRETCPGLYATCKRRLNYSVFHEMRCWTDDEDGDIEWQDTGV